MIEIRGLIKAFGNRPVLKKLDLTVNQGDFLMLVGPNGAGKTTLMNIVATLTKPTGGRLRIAGYDLQDDPVEIRRHIGLVSHKTLLYDDLSAEENLRFYARLYDVARPGERIEFLLNRLGLWGRHKDPVRIFSRGMQQRLSIARALLHRPAILLLDEPDTGLDQHSAQTLQDLLMELGDASHTILMTTHNLSRGLEWGSRVAILSKGRLAYQAERAEIDTEQFRDRYYQYVTAGN